MRVCACAAAVLVLAGTLSSAAMARGRQTVYPKCAISRIVRTSSSVAAVGACKLGRKRVAVSWKVQLKRLSAKAQACSSDSPTVHGRAVRLAGAGDFSVRWILRTAKKWHGRRLSTSRTIKLSLTDSSCGVPSAVPVPTSAVCDFGVAPANPKSGVSYCGQIYWYPPGGCADPAGGCSFATSGPPAAFWTSKPTIDGSTVTLDGFQDPAGPCQQVIYPYPSTDGWWHTTSFHNWQCGDQVVETDFLAWLVTPGGMQCALPSHNGDWGTGAVQFQVPAGWGGKLELVPGVTTYIGTAGKSRSLWQAVAYEDASAILPLQGSADGCAALGLPETPAN